jgi:hypothetical protein
MHNNPYKSPDKIEARTAIATPWQIWPRNWTLFVIVVFVIGIPSLFIPTIEMFKGTMSLGRAPVFWAYLGLLMPEYWTIALPIALAHFIGTVTIASMIDRRVGKWTSGAQIAHRVDQQDTIQITKNCSEVLDRPS